MMTRSDSPLVRSPPLSLTAAALLCAAIAVAAAPAAAQGPPQPPPVPDRGPADLLYHTFSIAAVDPETGESGVAVATRNTCVGAAVPWVRAGVGAVATQANSRIEYGQELLDLLARGVAPAEALAQALAPDADAARRQVGVIALDGRSAQHTGSATSPWAGHRAGPNHVTQGNLLVGPEVVEAVARTFEASEGTPRHLADRLVEALEAGHAAGGDARKGRPQSAAVVVADPRPGIARRPDRIAVNLQVCEHADPVAELRRLYGAVSQTLGFRTLQQQAGADVWQLKVLLHALGYFANAGDLTLGPDAYLYTPEAVDAVDRFRGDQGLSTPEDGSPPGLVDAETVARLWAAVEQAGRADEIRRQLLDATRIRR